MKLSIPRDQFLNPNPPRVFLCNTSKKVLGELPATSVNLNAKWRSYSELSFEIQRTYVDLIEGGSKIHPLYDKAEAPRNCLLEGYGYFSIQDVDDKSGDNDFKSITAFSLEYATSNKYLTNWHINTGEIDSKEVLYNEKLHGIDYNTDADSFYKLASGEFDPFESYYKKTQTEDSYTWEQVAIADSEEYAKYINSTSGNEYEKLYMKNFPNVQFYNRNRPELSLLHLVFEHIPGWEIGNVDQSLWRKERKFSEDRVSVYDFLNTTVAETFKCMFIWDSLSGLVHVYEEVEDDEIENEASTRWETDVFISKDNLASECSVQYSSDDIKTKLVVTGSDNLDIREVNLGRNEIMDLSFYHTEEWMEPDLFDAYSNYLAAVKEADTGKDEFGNKSSIYPTSYSEAMQGWVTANNRYNDITHHIPAHGNVVLIGDPFKKLYCSFTPVDTAYTNVTISSSTKWVDSIYSDAQFTKEITGVNNGTEYYVQGFRLKYIAGDGRFQAVENMSASANTALVKKLNLYHVDDDTEANKSDNILLKLKNSASDVVTIRIYDKKQIASSYDPDVNYYLKNDKGVYAKTVIGDQVQFNDRKAEYGDKLYTNDYRIQSIVIRASHGAPEAADTYTLTEWTSGSLTAQKMGLQDYKITYIGTMGAYFVLATDEKRVENLQDYGVNLLKERHETYTTIFQTQTEAMFSQEKYQCIAQDEEPEGDYVDGTRWLDTNSNPVVLNAYNGTTNKWDKIEASLSENDQKNYENYQRYIDNYEKLRSVQSVLSKKERESIYCLNGYAISDEIIDIKNYIMDSDGELRYNGKTLEGRLMDIAKKHFSGYGCARVDMEQRLPLYKFSTGFDTSHTFAVYLRGKTPYVAYANSQGVYQMIMEYIRDKTEMSNFFTKDQWIRLSPFIKEDEYNDSNFLLTGYESEEERIKICEELMESAAKELKTLCQPSLSFSMTMANILALPEFEPLFNQFQLGNFIKVGIRDGYVKRSRLLEVNMSFDDLTDFSCTFGNLVTTKSEIDKHAELLAQAVSAGKQVATAAGEWQRAVDKVNKLEEDISNGLRDAALAVGKASGQAISWDSTGMHFRKYKDGSTTEFEPEEMAIINNSLVATNDSWRTSKAAFGKYFINGEERWGPIAEYVTADTIEGKFIKGGTIQIGDETKEGGSLFIVNEDGSVQIKSGGTNYVNALKQIDDAYRYQLILTYDKSTIFSDAKDACLVTCTIYDYNENVTQEFIEKGAKFSWIRSSYGGDDSEWNEAHKENQTNTLTITTEDVIKNATFSCSVTIDDELLKTEETEEAV